jgi:2-keto-4-pentenoate hydratase/2-oxohepta-3-ene-1,7-dioic acid hydratase in catechol pathway
MKIICIGRNYAEHAREMGSEIPDEPVIFMKPKTALQKQNTPFYYPAFTNELHYECELVLRISKNGNLISHENAATYYDAITVGFDFTARDVQQECKSKGLPWEKAKAFDNSAAIGTFQDIKDFRKESIKFHLLKNNEVAQKGDTKDLLFPFEELIVQISKYFTLNIGDLVFTGTPAGVGECLPGDKLDAFLEDQNMLTVEVK